MKHSMHRNENDALIDEQNEDDDVF